MENDGKPNTANTMKNNCNKYYFYDAVAYKFSAGAIKMLEHKIIEFAFQNAP